MTIMFTTSFYAEFELYETDEPEALTENIKRAYFFGEDINPERFHLIGSQDDTETTEAIAKANKVVFIDDLEA